MKNINILLTCLLLPLLHLTAQEALEVTVDHIYLDEYGVCNEGSILIDATNSLVFPVEVEFTQAPNLNCWGGSIGNPPYELTLNSPYIDFVMPCSPTRCNGIYCFKVTREDCEIEFCKEVMYCKYTEGRIIKVQCIAKDDGIIHARIGSDKKNLVYTSGAVYPTDDKNINAEFTFYTELSDKKIDDISDKINEIMEAIIMETQETGYSIYEVKHQEEITTGDDYIFKFDENGDLIWVYYKGDEENKDMAVMKRSNDKNIHTAKDIKEKVTPNQEDNLEVISVFPNPFDDRLNFNINSLFEQEINIALFDLTGKEIKRRAYATVVGKNTFTMDITNAIPSGVYGVVITTGNGSVHSQKIIHNKK